MNKGFYTVATLENGHTVELNLSVGDVVRTQWGDRKVVKVERKPIIEASPSDGWDNGCE